MYLSQLKLDLSSRGGMAIAADAYAAHQFIYAAFGDAVTARPLYRREAGIEGVSFIVQSKAAPDWDRAMGMQKVYSRWTMKEYARPAIEPGMLLRFRLLANAVKTMKSDKAPSSGNEPKKKRVPLIKDESLLAWLDEQGKKHGFSIDRAIIRGKDTIETQRKSQPSPRPIVLAATLFEGNIRVDSADDIWAAVEGGLGHGKGFGLGLLSIAPLTRDGTRS